MECSWLKFVPTYKRDMDMCQQKQNGHDKNNNRKKKQQIERVGHMAYLKK